MANPMPGWYPDPEAPERQRFWDGNKWTDARAYPVVGADPNAVGGPPTGEIPEDKKQSNPWVVIALVAILAALLFFLLQPEPETVSPANEPLPSVNPTGPGGGTDPAGPGGGTDPAGPSGTAAPLQ